MNRIEGWGEALNARTAAVGQRLGAAVDNAAAASNLGESQSSVSFGLVWAEAAIARCTSVAAQILAAVEGAPGDVMSPGAMSKSPGLRERIGCLAVDAQELEAILRRIEVALTGEADGND